MLTRALGATLVLFGFFCAAGPAWGETDAAPVRPPSDVARTRHSLEPRAIAGQSFNAPVAPLPDGTTGTSGAEAGRTAIDGTGGLLPTPQAGLPIESAPPGIRNPLDRAWARNEFPPSKPLVNFSLSMPTTLTLIGDTSVADTCDAVDFAGGDFDTLYMLTQAPTGLYRVDTASGVATWIGPSEPIWPYWSGMSWNPADGRMYAIGSISPGFPAMLHVVDLTTGVATPVGVTGHIGVRSLAIDCQGRAFAHERGANKLLSVNLMTGAATVIGPLGFNVGWVTTKGGMDFDDSTGTLYMVEVNADEPPEMATELRTVDTATGATTLVAKIAPGTSAQLGSLAIQETCGASVGACCDRAGGVCTDYVSAADCVGPDRVFHPDQACATLNPPCALARKISYQGTLLDGGAPVNGAADFRFTFYDAATDGSPIGAAATTAGVSVVDGLFAAYPEFDPDLLDGRSLWLQVDVAYPSGNPVFTPLSPRQPIASTPMAIYADYAPVAGAVAGGVSWAQLTGVPASLADGVDNGASSWSELTGVPAGFADGVDNGGDGHSLDGPDGWPPNALNVDPNGNVTIGWGEASAFADLQIVGDPNIGTVLIGPNRDGVLQRGSSRLLLSGDFSGGSGVHFEYDGAGQALRVVGRHAGPTTHITVKELGPTRVGIGLDDPNLITDTLTVEGVVRSRTGGFELPDGTIIDAATDYGDISAVNAGSGLTGGGSAGDVTLSANFAGTGAATTVARSDHYHSSLAASDGSPAGAVVVDATGLTGVGTASPNTTLHVGAGSDATLASGSGFQVIGDVSGDNLVFDDDEIMARNNGAASTLYLNHDGGYVAIGNTVGYSTLHVESTAGNSGFRVRFDNNTKFLVNDNGSTSVGANAVGPDNGLYVAGNVGIGTATPTAKLHVGGTAGVDGIRFPDGTLQTTAAPYITAALTVDPPSLAAQSGTSVDVTVTGAASGNAVIANPGALTTGYMITYVRVAGANTVRIGLFNVTGGTVDPISSTWQIRVFK